MADRKQRLVYGILEFLETSMADGTVRGDDKESMEVAMQCISESFGVDFPGDKKMTMKPASLLSVFEVYSKMQEKRAGAAPTASSSSASTPAAPSASDKASAEIAKTDGNRLMASKSYDAAIAKYTTAISLDPTSPVYYSNRAAAYSQINKHELAIADAEKASEVDPTFAKAYSRLGHACFSSGRFQEAVEAYEKGLELEPGNSVMKTSLNMARSKLPATADDDDEDEEDDAAVSRGAPGAGGMPGLGGGGMPDMSSIMGMMNNPMMQNMMRQMQQNGGLEALMNDPSMRQMAEGMQRGGGMPDMASLMNNPALAQMARSFMGGGGAGAGGAGPQ